MRNWSPTSERTSRESWCLCRITAFSILGRAFAMIPGHVCKWSERYAIFTAISICKPASPTQPIRPHHTPGKSLLKVSPSNQARKTTSANLRLTTQITDTSDFYLHRCKSFAAVFYGLLRGFSASSIHLCSSSSARLWCASLLCERSAE